MLLLFCFGNGKLLSDDVCIHMLNKWKKFLILKLSIERLI